MTTETTRDPALDGAQDAICSNCGDPVKRRRPSLTGKHFCAKRGCVRAKDRFYYQRRIEGGAEAEAKQAEVYRQALVNFVHAVANAERVDCDTCGRPSVIPRYAHPVPDWSAPCNPPDRLPVSADPALTTELMRAVYPS